MKLLNGYKTYLGIALGAAGILCPILGAPLLACQVVGGAGALLAFVGAQHKDVKLLDSIATGRDMALRLDTIRAGMGLKK